MSKNSAKIFLVFIVAIIAFCLASVCAAMTGTYTLDLFSDDNSTDWNFTNNNTTIEVETGSSNAPQAPVKTEDVYVAPNDAPQQDSSQNQPSDEPSTDPGDDNPSGDVQHHSSGRSL